jgi:DNA polymerase-3 subunit epsilon
MRQIVLDTETTGLEPEQGHRIIEIGCVELQGRRLTGNSFHQYLQPDRLVDAAAIEVHGITNEFLTDKPRFADIAQDLLDYLSGAELIIHNAPFDVGFINAELGRIHGLAAIEHYCDVLDTLALARELHPGQRNSLDALCGRYDVSNAHRQKHGALLDAEILADVYLAMTGGQTSLSLEAESDAGASGTSTRIRRLAEDRQALPIMRASADELQEHERRLAAIDEASGGHCVWRRL